LFVIDDFLDVFFEDADHHHVFEGELEFCFVLATF